MKALRRLVRYLRCDLSEIVLPSSLPNPPDYIPPKRLSWGERLQAVREGTADYLATWKRAPPGPDGEQEQAPAQPTMMEELAATARSSHSLRPVLGRLYQTQVAALQQAATEFIAGYREGVAERPDLSAIFPRAAPAPTPQPAASATAPAAAGSFERQPEEVAERVAAAEPGFTVRPPGGGAADAAALRAMLARSAPPPSQAGVPRDAVSQALSEAEALAAGMLGGGGASPSQRRQLQAAIARAEAAMNAAQGLPGSGQAGAADSEHSDTERK